MTTLLPRVQRRADERFVPGAHTAMLSLPWWDRERREVTFVDLGDGWERTIVVLWPTVDREARRLDVPAIRAGQGVCVLPWDVRPSTRGDLDELTRVWPAHRHDVFVHGESEHPWLAPALRSVLELELGLDLDRRVAAAITRWCAARAA